MSEFEEYIIPLHLPDKYTAADWQENDIADLVSKTYSANWSEMGCRKTTTGLWTVDRKVKALGSEINPIILIVTTRSGKGTYFDAIPKSLEGYRVFDVGSNDADELEFVGDEVFRFPLKPINFWDATREKNLKQPAIILAHYHVFMNKCKMLPFLKKLGYAAIIVDEAHRIKEKDNQWTRNIKSLTCWTGYKHVMTGTGFINRPQELWSLLNFLDAKTFSSYNAFRKLFCDEFKTPSGFTVIRGVKPEMLEEFRGMRKNLGPRRLLRETNPDINLPVFTPLHVDLNATQRRMYNEIVRQLMAMDQAGMPLYTPNVLSMLSRCRQICVATPRVVEDYFDEKENRRVQKIVLEEPSSKLDMLMEFLDSLQWDDEEKNQVVVFSCFEDPLKLLQKRLENADIPYLWMKAGHNDAERYEMWHDVWPKKEHRVFMSTLQLGSESINLSAAKYCVFLDRSWSPKDNNQGVSRIYRPGQTDTAQIIHINAIKTTDQRIERVNEVKEGWFKEVFGEGEEPFKTIADEALEFPNPKSEEDELIDKAFSSPGEEEERAKLDPELEAAIAEIENEVNPGWKEALAEETGAETISDVEVIEAEELLKQALNINGNKSNVVIIEQDGVKKLIL
jgi:SNF2 family DNA or RNA helicase